MNTFKDWIPVIIPITVAVIAVVNAWALKLFEIRKTKATPVNTPDTKIEPKMTAKSRVSLLVTALLLLLSACSIVWQFEYPSSNQNVNTLLISVNVSMFFFTVAVNVVLVPIIRRLLHISEQQTDVIGAHMDFTNKLSDKIASNPEPKKKKKNSN